MREQNDGQDGRGEAQMSGKGTERLQKRGIERRGIIPLPCALKRTQESAERLEDGARRKQADRRKQKAPLG